MTKPIRRGLHSSKLGAPTALAMSCIAVGCSGSSNPASGQGGMVATSTGGTSLTTVGTGSTLTAGSGGSLATSSSQAFGSAITSGGTTTTLSNSAVSLGGSGAITNCVEGNSCPTSGATCIDATGVTCHCVGPAGASIITCYGSGTGGNSGTGGTTARGGTSSNGGTTNGNTSSNGGTASGLDPNLGVPCTGTAPWTTAGTPATQLTINAGQRGSAWNRYYEKVVANDHAYTVLSTAWGRNVQGALKKGHDQAGFQFVRFHGLLDSDVAVYSETNGTPVYNFDRLDQIYDAILAVGMKPFVEISFMPPALASDGTKTLHWYNGAPANISPPKDWNKWMDFMAALVVHLEARYGTSEVRSWYFEIWNEASWMYSLGMAGYNELYGYTVKGLTRADAQIRVGGPAESGGGSAWGISSLINYAKTNGLKLDFVSYHYYGQDSDTNLALTNATINFHGTMVSTVNNAKFAGELFSTEWGPAYSMPAARDNEIGASFIAKVVHRIGTNASVAAPSGYGYWTLSDFIEEFNSGTATAFRNGNWGMLMKGDSRYPESYDVPKAPFNAFRLLHKMSDVNLIVSGGNATNGINAAATVASNGGAIQVLVYNHTDGGLADSAASSLVRVTWNNLPFTSSSLRLRHYVLDKTRANAYDDWVQMGKPNTPTQAQWVTLRDAAELCYYETAIAPTGGSFSVMYPQNNYSVGLLEVVPK